MSLNNSKYSSVFNLILLIKIIISLCCIKNIKGHGMMLEPPGRSSRWRFNKTAPPNYEDNQLFCGGFNKQWNSNNGKCGLCGDDYTLPIPRPNELGGKYGEGIIVKTYQSGNLIPVGIKITANHKGYFYFHLCNLDNYNYIETESCYNDLPLQLINGEYKFYVTNNLPGWFNLTLKLPDNLICNHCILRWTYNCGNNWGMCPNGTGAVGCGPQENFRSCADIKIESNYYNYNYYKPQIATVQQQHNYQGYNYDTSYYNNNDYLSQQSINFIDNNRIDNNNNNINSYQYNLNNLENSNNFANKVNDGIYYNYQRVQESQQQQYNQQNYDSNSNNNNLEFNIPNVPIPILNNLQ